MKRDLTVWLVAITLISILACAVPTAGAMIVYVNDTDGTHGTTVDIPINVSDAPGLVGAMDISLTYNPSVLTALGTVNGSLTAGVLIMNETTITKPYPDNWTDASISDTDNQTVWNYGALANDTTATDGVVNISIISRYGFNGTGPIAAVRFEVIGPGGDTSPLTLSTVAAYNLSAPITNEGGITTGYESISVTPVNGTFTVKDGGYAKGDLDHNGQVADAVDVAMMLQASVGDITATSEYDLDDNGQNADAVDVAMMLQASVGDITLE
jgi:hypothetical protein